MEEHSASLQLNSVFVRSQYKQITCHGRITSTFSSTPHRRLSRAGLNRQQPPCRLLSYLLSMALLQQLANIWRGPGTAVGKASSSAPVSPPPPLTSVQSSAGI